VTPKNSWLRRLTASTTVGAMLLIIAPAVLATSAGTPDSLSSRVQAGAGSDLVLAGSGIRSRRRIVHYTVQSGDSVTGLAVRFHAWTDELLKINHLTPGSTIYVGERLLIPVVRKKDRHKAHKPTPTKHHKPRHDPPRPKPAPKPAPSASPWPTAEPSRTEIRRVVIGVAKRHGVDPDLALAVAWQESSWRLHVISSAHAVGTMQVLPGTGAWMADMLDRPLNLYRLHDNVTAGVALLKWLHQEARGRRQAVAGYYQGLGGVQAHGMYPSTKRYVASVMSLKRRIAAGWNPA
jgi:LysM repeat protein